jgi:cytochrome c oxidase cbb3-type subunit I/II
MSTAAATAIERKIVYDDGVVRKFLLASCVFGLVGMLVGVLAASQLAWHQLNFGIPYTTFSRIRPLHTNAVIFAFVGNMIFAGMYYSTQRLLKTRMASDFLSSVHFWGWQLIIVAAAITLPLGITTSKEYAELEWPIDLAITVVWVVFAINFFWTLAKRNEKNLYVAIWFYIATIVTVAVLHVVNSLAIPVSWLKSYSVFAGVQDALVQWWYGHNAVAFFLTTPVLGIMYYFVPKAAERPVYSYRLSVVHFWSLVFVYIWAGPHHLLGTALPEWAQTLGMVFSLMLIAPSWGGMLNGLLTLRGVWDRVRKEPVLKFYAAALTFYGMATFEGPLLSIKSVSSLGHYTDWIIGHVHGGALGWNGFMAAGMFYWLVPKLWNRELHSKRAADLHFWMGTVGIILYMVAMWVSGITQGMMWRATNGDGALMYPDFVETLLAIRPLYVVRMIGGTLYLVGFVVMMWNLVKTIAAGKAVDGEATVIVERAASAGPVPSWAQVVVAKPMLVTYALVGLTLVLGWSSLDLSIIVIGVIAALSVGAALARRPSVPGQPSWHAVLEGRPLLFTVLTLVAILVGGVAEILPTVAISKAVPKTGASQEPYSPLELEGRDVYVREGCYTCHSQNVRPFRWETQRFGAPSRAEEFQYDHPFQWGSKRTGPDLSHEGGRYPHAWHYQHLMDPRAVSGGSNMPSFAWLATARVDAKQTGKKMQVMRTLGVPYKHEEVDTAAATLTAQGEQIAAELAKDGVKLAPDSEMAALIAYLQRLGRGPQFPSKSEAGRPTAAAPAPVGAQPGGAK